MRQIVHAVIFVLLLFWALALAGFQRSQGAKVLPDAKTINATSQASIQTRPQIPYRDAAIQIAADKVEQSGEMSHFSGKVRIAVEDMTVTCDSAAYDPTTHILKTSGQVKISHDQIRMAASDCVIYLDQLQPKRK